MLRIQYRLYKDRVRGIFLPSKITLTPYTKVDNETIGSRIQEHLQQLVMTSVILSSFLHF